MSALAVILTAAIVVPGEVPEEISNEVAEPQRLDLSGKWEGTVRIDPDFTVPATYQDGKLTTFRFGKPETATFVFIDQGGGKCRCRCVEANQEALGIYKWNKEELVLCMGKHGQRPSSFQADDVLIFTIHRVKLGK